jgi:hypothetical protein
MIRTQFVVFCSTLSLAIGSALAQEAVDLEKAPTPSEEAPPEAATTPTRTKEKSRASQERPKKSLQELMRPEEFKAAGLDKLSEDELEHLDAWLQGYRQTAEKKANEQAEARATDEIKKASDQAEAKANEQIKKATEEAAKTARVTMDTIISRVNGKFEGLKGRTIVRLEDGTAWVQANADDRYRTPVTDHPTAIVVHGTFGYRMRIEGMPDFYVDPVRK